MHILGRSTVSVILKLQPLASQEYFHFQVEGLRRALQGHSHITIFPIYLCTRHLPLSVEMPDIVFHGRLFASFSAGFRTADIMRNRKAMENNGNFKTLQNNFKT
jgi:hypothetical protein